jgi:hypothetical protein
MTTGYDMEVNEIAKEQARARKEKFKDLAVAGGETMFLGFCSAVGMALAALMFERVRRQD